MPDNTVILNNYLQNRGMAIALSWDEQKAGPQNAPQWTVFCKVNGEVIGTGVGATKTTAKAAAAEMALTFLNTQAAAGEAPPA